MQNTSAIEAKRRVAGGPELSHPGEFKVCSRLSDAIQGRVDEPLPLMVYYPVNRFVLSALEDSPYDRSYDVLAAYDDALIAGQISFQRFFEWYRVREDVENEELRWKAPHPEKGEETTVKRTQLDPQLEAVRQAIYSVLPGDFSSLRVERTPRPRMSIVKQGTKLFLDQLSDGEKCLLAMSGDLARRMAIANPGLEKPLESPGVVLIDEVDLHLHPEWQRKVVPALERTFPNCQFIVTTHSPQVLSGARDILVYLLVPENGSIRSLNYESPFGRDSNWILEEVMGVEDRPPEIKEKVMRYLELIDDYEMEKARELEAELALELGDDYPELVKGRARTRRKEILGK
jgi:predicted ATP-binding protein involved in virulence